MIDFRCPYCRCLLEIHPRSAGRRKACPECHGVFRVPLPTAGSPARRRPSSLPALGCLAAGLVLACLLAWPIALVIGVVSSISTRSSPASRPAAVTPTSPRAPSAR